MSKNKIKELNRRLTCANALVEEYRGKYDDEFRNHLRVKDSAAHWEAMNDINLARRETAESFTRNIEGIIQAHTNLVEKLIDVLSISKEGR